MLGPFHCAVACSGSLLDLAQRGLRKALVDACSEGMACSATGCPAASGAASQAKSIAQSDGKALRCLVGHWLRPSLRCFRLYLQSER